MLRSSRKVALVSDLLLRGNYVTYVNSNSFLLAGGTSRYTQTTFSNSQIVSSIKIIEPGVVTFSSHLYSILVEIKLLGNIIDAGVGNFCTHL